MKSNPFRKLAMGTVFGVFAATAFLPLASATTRTAHFPRPAVAAVAVTPKTLPANGGSVRLVVHVRYATTCNVIVTPVVPRFSRSFRCASGHFVATVKIDKNTSASGRTIRFRVFAKGPGGRSPFRVAFVSQATDTGPIGATLNVHDSSGNALAVTVSHVVDPATGANEFYQPSAGDRFVAVEMNLSNQSSNTISSDANNNVTVIGSDNQAYTADFDSVSDCTNFSSGEFTVLPGSSESGCVVFQLPNAISVKAVQFSFDSAFLDTAQWNA